ncbi:leucine-rich repeat domain-containing protein [Flavobacterium sp. N502540]|uniref:leucine-rich repeat domain-containing protein n=1 Tax=Flavobacterium sp. N502540 TaxID=2986838 RepID=UPI0022246586|nr:leucine-rich repeat domain-containing protein [Flavobacterium sp. N502540]
MGKPIQILKLEKKLNVLIEKLPSEIKYNRNSYCTNDNEEIIVLNLCNAKVCDISFLNEFPSLQKLYLSNNEISDISNLKNLKYLTVLYLDNNEISEISVFESLTSLTDLNLSANQISDISSLIDIDSLRTLNLSKNNIYDLYGLGDLVDLLHLDLSNNEILDISVLYYLSELKTLDICSNEISDISYLEFMDELNSLNISSNEIFDISVLKNLVDLSTLNLSNNKIIDVSDLADLTNLSILDLSENNISDISVLENLSELTKVDLKRNQISDILALEGLINLNEIVLGFNLIEDISPLKTNINLKTIYCNKNKIKDISSLKELINVSFLNFEGNQISDIEVLKCLGVLKNVNLSSNPISDISVFKTNITLTTLYLSNIKVNDFSILENLTNLTTLFLGNNKISDISFLKKLHSLDFLFLGYNQISDISILRQLTKLKFVYLYGNKIFDLSVFSHLKSLVNLDISSNKIIEIEQFEFIINFPSLRIQAQKNPCFANILLEDKNNYDTILNALKKINESKRKYSLPAKVLFLGNTESGKSTFLDYILQTKEPRIIKNNLHSTHIVQIETLPKKIRKGSIPKAVFYDFGGQDYYHGLYKAFLSNDSINILLWNKDYDKNQIRKDRNGQLTRDYNRNYWLNQLKFQYNRNKENKENLELEKAEPILLVQTHADLDKHKRENYKGDCERFNIKNEFFISLNDDSVKKSIIHSLSLNFLEETLKELITQKQIVKNEPIWYKDFLNFILRTTTSDYIFLSEIGKEYKRDSDPDKLLLPEVLRELALAGLVLYYKDDIDLKDIVWVDPSKTIQYIHDTILSQQNVIEKKGIIEKEVLDEFTDHKLIKLLLNQKVIFFDELDDKYIIPGYLCLTEEDDRIYELLTFDFIEPNFIMKFEYFIPFGLINQLICYYGKNKHKKYYWRDQLLFTKDSCKVLIKLDFNNLEISVSIKSKRTNSKLNNLEQEIFRDILNLYWDKPRLEENDVSEKAEYSELKTEVFHNISKTPFESPDDLYVSIDYKNFVHHKTLENKEKTINKITAFGLDYRSEMQNERNVEIRKIDKTKSREQASGLYKNFTTNKNTETMKKIFISYAKENKKEVNEFQKQIAPFKITREVETWHCSELELGEDWDAKIKSKFYEADIILYFVSVDFFSTPFILDEEVKRGIERSQDPNDKVALVPIILEKIHWGDLLGKYSSNFKGVPISLYDKPNNAWYEIVDQLKRDHFRKIDPNSTAGIIGQAKDTMKTQEDIIAGKL